MSRSWSKIKSGVWAVGQRVRLVAIDIVGGGRFLCHSLAAVGVQA
jgi:hypothetical protein